MVRKTYFAASIDQTKATLTGILLELDKEYFKMVAIDGFRLAINKFNDNRKEEAKIIERANKQHQLIEKERRKKELAKINYIKKLEKQKIKEEKAKNKKSIIDQLISKIKSKNEKIDDKDSIKEEYIQIKEVGSGKEYTYLVPNNIILSDGQKIKMFTEHGTIASAIVIKGNYKNEKNKANTYKTIRLVDSDYWNL